jgi:hypothetical protein
MTGRCTCPIYYQGVVGLEKGSVVIRYKLPELIKKVSEAEIPALPQPCFKHDRQMYLSDILPGSY